MHIPFIGSYTVCKAGTTSTADMVLAIALFEIRPYLAFANFCCMLWAGPSTHRESTPLCYGPVLLHLTVSSTLPSLPDLPLIPHHPSDDFTSVRPYQVNYLLSSPPSPIFGPRQKKLFIFCACARCALIRIKMCTN